jgi:cation diffusion facilitator CzcD-associated flavoprotein CzcO
MGNALCVVGPQIPGMSQWPGLQLHAHNFRGAVQFKGQKVMVVGASFSGQSVAGICRLASTHAPDSGG